MDCRLRVQVGTGAQLDARLIDLDKAASSKDYSGEFKACTSNVKHPTMKKALLTENRTFELSRPLEIIEMTTLNSLPHEAISNVVIQ